MSITPVPVGELVKVLTKLNEKIADKDKPNLFTVGTQNNWSDVHTWISTGNTLLDIAMTSYDVQGNPCGSGWACGRWYEVFGEEAQGKSTIIEHLFAETQKAGGIPGLIDSESKFYKPRAARIGVDLDRLVLCDAPYFERGIEAFNMFMEALRAKETFNKVPVAWAWDTIAAVDTKAEYESGDYAGGQAAKARAAHSMFRDLTNKLPEYNAVFVLVNQIRDTMGGRFDKQTDTTGGRGAKYQSSARIELQKFGVYTDPENSEVPMGIMVRVKLVKSSLFRPFAEIEVPINFDTGMDNHLNLVQFHTTHSKVFRNQSGVYYCKEYFGEEAPGKRLGPLLRYLKEDELFFDFLVNKAWEHKNLLWKKSATYANKKPDEKQQ